MKTVVVYLVCLIIETKTPLIAVTSKFSYYSQEKSKAAIGVFFPFK